jgi:type III restriction enzyme
MSQIELLPFQTTASNQILERYVELTDDQSRPHQTRDWPVPFYQALASITGSGKTAILADAIAQLRAAMPTEPIVLWSSLAKAVVEQTIANFESGGKYAHLIPDYIVMPLSELNEDHVRDASTPLLAITTVGTYNDKDRHDGTRKVHKASLDKTKDPLWKVLRNRPSEDRVRRPLVIVYDEAQNLSNQQTDLLLELEPDVILVASATPKIPEKLAKLIERLKQHGWKKDKLCTGVRSLDVVNEGLVKRQLIVGGYTTTMELALDDMLDVLAEVTKKAKAFKAGFKPKAIYVCRTNISQIDGTRDNPARPFEERQAPPIRIWRYLVEKKGIDPEDIAVYCDLKVDRKHNAPPENFKLFSGGDDDFAAFSSGDFHHIIFNQSLQEGWDDPSCCFAYIDKSMGSPIKVEQVIGRVLRPPGARHYQDADLNSAHFYIRIDEKQIFPEILKTVRKEIGGEIPQIRIDTYSERRDRTRIHLEPKKAMKVPEIYVPCDLEPVYQEVDSIIDYTDGTPDNIYGKGERYKAVQTVGDGSTAQMMVESAKHSNLVTARWIVRRGVQALCPRAAGAIDWSDKKFDARVEVTSRAAATLRDAADKLVNTYLSNASLTFEDKLLYVVGPVIVDPEKLQSFKNSIHAGYSDISPSETPYAEAIDALGLPWVRNPANGGFSIPLLKPGGTFNFYPDFLVWKEGVIFALDPKGTHLINDAAGRKLLEMRDEKGRQKVVVRLLTEGQWQDPSHQKSTQGFSVWSIQAGSIKPRHYKSIPDAIQGALKLR